MKPAGPERDKQIAELMGDISGICELGELNEYYDGWKCTCGTAGDWNSTDHSILVKPYSTDIATAMELWEEMKAGVIELQLIYNFGDFPILCELALTEYQAYHDTGKIQGVGKTEADAISGAYVKWRESDG